MTETSSAYRVLARKYRPTRLDDLIGQDALVRTLTQRDRVRGASRMPSC
jgi:replication-associated recombination protein RarA